MVTQKSGFPAEMPRRADGGAKAVAVLVVDDDASVARSLQRVLEAEGYDVTVEASGIDAIATILARPFDVVLSDIRMPGMTGVELLSAVRANDLDVPVILMTGVPTVETAIEAVSLGAMQYLPKPTSREVLLRAIERASRMHRLGSLKRSAARQVVSEQAANDQIGLGIQLDRALSSMWMAFHPIVDVSRCRVFGYEALMRTREPSLPHPGAVLNAAERLGRLPEVGGRVRVLCAEAFEGAPADALLFVNLHPRDLLDNDLYEAGSPLTRMAGRVVLEITERSAIDDVKDLQARIAVLRYHGFRIAIDDLGAGYAGLSSFVALGPDIVKLDMSLVRGVHLSEIRKRLIGSMAKLCTDMAIGIVAEGVEVREEAESLRLLGCDLLQGYLFAKPGPPFPAVETFS
jgi:EAL domain-containing protein (putative c-di-GMP-specific phosphodiesterase class I)